MAAPKKSVDVTETPEKEPIDYPTQPDVVPTGYMPPQVYAAMVKAQAEIGNIAKDAKNPHFKNKFVSLEAASNAIIPILNKNGLFVSQGVEYRDGKPTLSTTIYHEDGSFVGGFSYPLVTKDDNDPQKVAASMTYARRYSLMAIVGAAPEDDDGNLAAKPAEKKEPTAKEKLLDELQKMKANADKFKQLASTANVKAERYADLTEDQAQKMLDSMGGSVPF